MKDRTIMNETLVFRDERQVQLPEGPTLVIDPCYVFGHMNNVSWDDFCDGFFEVNANTAVLNYKGIDILVSNTAHGDGEYSAYTSGQKGTFGVDAGLFCLISYSEVSDKAPELLPFFNAEYMESGELTFSPDCACVLNVKAGVVRATDNGGVVGVVNIETEDDFDDEEEDDLFDDMDEDYDPDWDIDETDF